MHKSRKKREEEKKQRREEKKREKRLKGELAVIAREYGCRCTFGNEEILINAAPLSKISSL